MKNKLNLRQTAEMKKNRGEIVVVAMSGGADSTYAAYLLKSKGYKVIGMMAKFWSEQCDPGAIRDNLCCTPESIAVAHRNAKKLGIEFLVVDLSKEFKEKVVDYYINEYKNCRTPNPCIICNREIKFGLLFNKAMALGADYFATGHYARIASDSGNLKSQIPKSQKYGRQNYYIEKAKDETKDQSYFLWAIQKENLPKILFPLGDHYKKDILAHIKKLGLEIQTKESQDICFIANGTNTEFLKRYIKAKSGKIVDTNGSELGRHSGLFNFTIGQRHGLGLALPEPHYVVQLDSSANNLVVGTEDDLEKKVFELETAQFMDIPAKNQNLLVKIRFGHKGQDCHINGNVVNLLQPTKAVTPGQSAVFYDGGKLVGGGIIGEITKNK